MAVATRRRLAVPTAVAVAGGAVLAVQAYVNGRLGRSLGSPEHAAVINNVVGLAVLVALTVTTRGAPRAVRRWRDVRAWYLLGGLGGAMFVAAGAIAAPRIGVALLSLALVCGQTTGSLVADRLGLSPAGRQHITAIRLLGVGLAVVAVAVSALGAHTRPEAGVLAFALLAGVASSFQQAANGRLARATGEPIFASAVNFAVGAVALVAAAAIMTGLSPEHGWSGRRPSTSVACSARRWRRPSSSLSRAWACCDSSSPRSPARRWAASPWTSLPRSTASGSRPPPSPASRSPSRPWP